MRYVQEWPDDYRTEEIVETVGISFCSVTEHLEYRKSRSRQAGGSCVATQLHVTKTSSSNSTKKTCGSTLPIARICRRMILGQWRNESAMGLEERSLSTGAPKLDGSSTNAKFEQRSRKRKNLSDGYVNKLSSSCTFQ